MTTETLDPIELFARLDPLSAEQLGDLAHGPERETTFARIAERREGPPARARRLPRRRLVAVAVIVLALAIPTLAFSGRFGSLFGFSTHGAPVSPDDLSRLSAALRLTGASPGSLVKLASRDGWAFYAGRAADGDVCYFDEPTAQNPDTGWKAIGGGGFCANAAGAGDFPSPARPVLDGDSIYNNQYIERLAGFAADGVASVQVLALSDCHVVATAPVIDNVYIADNLPLTIPEAQIVARDPGGNVVWHQAVGAGIDPAPPSNSCGLG